MRHEMDTIKSGLCQRISDGEIFHYSQNRVEQNPGFAILTSVQPEEYCQLNDLECALSGLPFGSKMVKDLGLCDLSYGFRILS